RPTRHAVHVEGEGECASLDQIGEAERQGPLHSPVEGQLELAGPGVPGRSSHGLQLREHTLAWGNGMPVIGPTGCLGVGSESACDDVGAAAQQAQGGSSGSDLDKSPSCEEFVDVALAHVTNSVSCWRLVSRRLRFGSSPSWIFLCV